MIYRPKDLLGRMNALNEKVMSRWDAEMGAQIEAIWTNVPEVLSRVAPVYEWNNGTFTVIVPRSSREIFREGRLQNDCLGNREKCVRYYNSISKDDSYIFFLRRADAPETPWYTMEVEPGGKVRQLRAFGEEKGKDRDVAKQALEAWRADIATRFDEQIGALAAISRDNRMKNFEELRANGKTVISGACRGQLLVDVLEADFAELNLEVV